MKGRQIQFEDTDYFLEPYFTKIRNFCDEEGLTLKRDYSITESGKKYQAFKSFGNNDGKIYAVYITYYEDGYEIFGEIKVDLEEKRISMEFPLIQVFSENNL